MIIYERGAFWKTMCMLRGSVYPFALSMAVPCSLLTGILKLAITNFPEHMSFMSSGDEDKDGGIISNSAVWSGFSFFVGFLIVFRTSTAYNRFWDGCTSVSLMRSEWFDACSSVCAFTHISMVSPEQVEMFKHTLVRLVSVLHALALAQIEDINTDNPGSVAAFNFELLDVTSLDPDMLIAIQRSTTRTQLVFQWIQVHIMDGVKTGIVAAPPPIVSRAFQELSNGMVQFHEALKISSVPFPFPYAQCCDVLLCIHWWCTPLVTAQWVTAVGWAILFSFTQVFILWALNRIAVEIENPFGSDANDLNCAELQDETNTALCMLMSDEARLLPSVVDSDCERRLFFVRDSLAATWVQLAAEENNQSSCQLEIPRARRSQSDGVGGPVLKLTSEETRGVRRKQPRTGIYAEEGEPEKNRPRGLRAPRTSMVSHAGSMRSSLGRQMSPGDDLEVSAVSSVTSETFARNKSSVRFSTDFRTDPTGSHDTFSSYSGSQSGINGSALNGSAMNGISANGSSRPSWHEADGRALPLQKVLSDGSQKGAKALAALRRNDSSIMHRQSAVGHTARHDLVDTISHYEVQVDSLNGHFRAHRDSRPRRDSGVQTGEDHSHAEGRVQNQRAADSDSPGFSLRGSLGQNSDVRHGSPPKRQAPVAEHIPEEPCDVETNVL
eukprot:TRINITY_DN47715_c0_g1_i1.p1 TRINITY_DN47715_c0_g1~~TRINITY_DN47715_c0_g1_i1.p1  ORF type:complete len:666 (-),score=110.68 TRINITY_DN47715_c0_g1_i1:100-2097(-)